MVISEWILDKNNVFVCLLFFSKNGQTALSGNRATAWFKDRRHSLYFKVGLFFAVDLTWKSGSRYRHRMGTQQEQRYLARMKCVSREAATGSALPAADMVILFRVDYVFWCTQYTWDLRLLTGLHFQELIAYSVNPSQAPARRACQLNALLLLPEACCAIVAQSQMRRD